tara:strand:+ start:193 stop:648 length:456 start_codon:yes stop_codon:yes gene_type:complete
LINFFLNDKNRKYKIFISLLIIFLFSFYSYSHGKSEISLKQKVKLHFNSIHPFPYLLVTSIKKNLVTFQDKWGVSWVAKWRNTDHNLSKGMFVSFKGRLNQKNEIVQIKNVIIHKGYKIKLYISILALIILLEYFSKVFSVNSNGIYRKNV